MVTAGNTQRKIFYAKDRKAWRAWLQKYHAIEKNVWLHIYKKQSRKKSVTYVEAVEEALCFGWIDSTANKRDNESYIQLFARRNPKSRWSSINKKRVGKLIEEKLMTPAGMEAIDIARQNGAWEALEKVDQLTLPPDLKKEFAKNKAASKNFEQFPVSSKKIILEWIYNAKRPETRAKRIVETVRLAAKNERANHFKR